MERPLREKLLAICEESNRLFAAMSTQEIASDPAAYRDVAKKHKSISALVRGFREYEKNETQLASVQALLREETDAEMRALADDERLQLEAALANGVESLKVLLIPRDPNDEKNTIVEIRAGTGGDEAALFASDLYRAYSRYAETKGWKIEVLSSHETGLRGYKEIVFKVTGDSVYSQLKYEGGVHRVQRVPETEASGRIHTSAVTVAVLPEAEEVEVHIDPNDLVIDVYRSSGPGGQSVNTTDSAVRVTHKPTGLVVTCQDEKSQHKNKAKAIVVLRARLYAMAQEEEAAKRSETRKSQVSTGDRSAKIRTYNYPENRVTDHRIKLTIHRLEQAMEGEFQDLIDGLIAADRAAMLAEA
ncbi:MAG: peptide chain release factor 1 [Candidatus Hydrogenedentota bacterium]